MSRVARSARVASRQRVESISADKTIQSAETGELYLVDASAGNVVVTLPAAQDGAYFKFILAAANGGGTTMTIQSSDVDVDGMLIQIDVANHTSAGVDKGAGSDKKVVFGNSASAGSYVEIFCSGTEWFAHGIAHDGTLEFAT